MRRFSNYISEGCTTSDVNQGNGYITTGVTNHLTPVGNIVTGVRNLFSPLTGIVASVGEDGFSVKLNSSKFVSKQEVNNILYDSTYMRGTNIANYIMSQGLDQMKIVDLGQFMVVYFGPSDIKNAKTGKEPEPSKFPCTEMRQYYNDEAEMYSLIVEDSDDDDEMEDVTNKKIVELIKSKDKVKAAKQFEILITQEIELPREYYFAGVKDKEGNESIALRWKYVRKRPFGKSSESVRSLMNIFDMSKEGIWIQDFVKDSMFKLPDEVDKLIHTILDFLNAEETNDPAVWSLDGSTKDKKKEKKDKDEDKEEDEDDNKDVDSKSKSDSDSDDEDDKSRGDDSDDLLS